MYLFDSDIIIDYLKGKDPGLSLIKPLLDKKSFISIISWSEVLFGFKGSENPKERMKCFNLFLKLSESKILPINKSVAKKFVDSKFELKKAGKIIGDFVILVASTALANKLTLVTGNEKHFKRISGLKLFSR